MDWYRPPALEVGAVALAAAAAALLTSRARAFARSDWCSIDQTDKQPGIAALPAYVAACQAIVEAWNDEYAQRAWCNVELLTAHAFMPAGQAVFVLGEGFVDHEGLGEVRCPRVSDPAHASRPVTRRIGRSHCPQYIIEEYVPTPDPARGVLTDEGERAGIAMLIDIASASRVFTCWRVLVSKWRSSPLCYPVVCCTFGVCGVGGLVEISIVARDPRPGKGFVIKVTPRDPASPCTDGLWWWPRASAANAPRGLRQQGCDMDEPPRPVSMSRV